ncbi:ABC transporter substrate-binding protein [Streptomyces zagrosensis]|uniref:Peptide/nickel transport system substrate-binding protein n=1 Tax=Streptomyces zagrosensis TaxID=1042984 RepID=A0A7W9V154_9ACTN|nr:ABC transporter substrate-binding protein [Streptomyces zagrosensis]MBB5938835.1 peptide/nickel transport system substrate-binding protein [Streptomyces zagrosensis]
MNRKTMVLPAMAGLLTSVLAGCGGTSGAGSGGDSIVVGSTDLIEATDAAPAPLDPAQVYDVGAWGVMHNVFQTLVRMPRSGNQPAPDAARNCGFQDKQSEQFRCTLREGLTFANGHELTAKDVVFSFQRTLGIDYENGPLSLTGNIDKVEAASELEVVFHLKSPDATFPHKLATPAAALLDSEDYDKGKLRAGFEASGSGPYTLRTETHDNRLTKAVFTKNPDYKGAVEVKNSKVEMRFFDDSKAMEKALTKGDISALNRTLAPEQIVRLRDGGQADVKVTESSGQEIRYLAFNTNASSVREKATRQAMAQLIDRPALARDVYRRTTVPLYSLVPTGTSAHTNSFHNTYGEPSVAKARKILRDAGVTTPVKLTLSYSSDHYGPASVKEFQTLQGQLNASRLFEAKIQDVPWSKFRPAAAKGKYAAYGMGWYPDFPDPDNYIAPFFGADNFLNSPYRNTMIEDVLIRRTRQQEQRTAAVKDFQQIQDIVADEVPVLPLWQGKQYVATRDGVTGAEWAVDDAGKLRLWELGRGVDG